MSVLSEKLNYFVGQRGVNIADLAKRCRIERSTLYQYLKDRRPLQNKVQLEALMSELHLTPDERAEMLEAYEIARIGMRDYSRRCKVRELLDSLLTVEETHPVRHEAEYDADAGEPEPHCLLQGELEVSRAVNSVIHEAVARGSELKILAQPDFDSLMESLLLLCDGSVDAKVIQIICMEADSGQDGCRNLDSVRQILRYGIGIRHYEPRYYYGRAAEHFGMMNAMPYLIVTGQYAMQISSDRKTAILHDTPEIVTYFGHAFDRMCQQTRPLMTSVDGFGGRQARWGLGYLDKVDFSNTIEICSGLCSVQFWDEQLIRQYLNHAIPGYETMAGEYTAYTAALYQKKKSGHITVLMNSSFVEEFIKTGVFREYPNVFFDKPVAPADRRVLIERILQAVDEGWYHIRMMPEEDFRLSYRWEVLACGGSSLLLQYSAKSQFRLFQFEEADVLDAVYDFLESLAEKESVLDDQQSASLLQDWMEKYLA